MRGLCDSVNNKETLILPSPLRWEKRNAQGANASSPIALKSIRDLSLQFISHLLIRLIHTPDLFG
jgi:hypothetical protein